MTLRIWKVSRKRHWLSGEKANVVWILGCIRSHQRSPVGSCAEWRPLRWRQRARGAAARFRHHFLQDAHVLRPLRRHPRRPGPPGPPLRVLRPQLSQTLRLQNPQLLHLPHQTTQPPLPPLPHVRPGKPSEVFNQDTSRKKSLLTTSQSRSAMVGA